VTAPRASFRDPDGSVYLTEGRVIRRVEATAASGLRSLMESRSVKRLVAQGDFIEGRELTGPEAGSTLAAIGMAAPTDAEGLLLEHPRVAFPSFAHEWCPEMLHAAGRLTLEIAAVLQGDGLGLKDATPHNVLFQGPKPVFIDVASLEKRDPGNPTWLPHAQFTRTFLLPLLVNKRCAIPLDQIFLAHRDGLAPEGVYGLLGAGRRLSPAFLFSVSIPTWLSRRATNEPEIYRPRAESPDKAAFILNATMKHLRRQLDGAAPDTKSSVWSDYMDTKSYQDEDFETKERFVCTTLGSGSSRTVLDIGCNTGHFSELAARTGATVVALDSDPVCVGQTYRRAVANSLSILPLVANIARPSPALGWRNGEQASLLERLSGRFDLVLMLAVLHHLLVTERIPLHEILGLAAELTTDLLVIEYVGPSDPMFRKLVRGRDSLYAHVTAEWFEAACIERFEIIEAKKLAEADRRLYLLKRKAA
jgi:SAM-dependent methyltransferase